MPTKVAVVTGASSGIGEATVRALAREGLRLVLAARREDRLRRLADELAVEALPVRCDVTKKGDLRALVRATEERFGRCDILVNNAGIPSGGPFADVPLTRLEEVTATNYLAVLRATKLFLPLLLASRGHVVNIASIAGRFAVPGAAAYTATKHAVVALSESVLWETMPHGVRVTAVCPGLVDTEGFPHPDAPPALAVTADEVARTIVDVLRRGRVGTVSIPAWPAPFAAIQALAPPLYRAIVGLVVRRYRARG